MLNKDLCKSVRSGVPGPELATLQSKKIGTSAQAVPVRSGVLGTGAAWLGAVARNRSCRATPPDSVRRDARGPRFRPGSFFWVRRFSHPVRSLCPIRPLCPVPGRLEFALRIPGNPRHVRLLRHTPTLAPPLPLPVGNKTQGLRGRSSPRPRPGKASYHGLNPPRVGPVARATPRGCRLPPMQGGPSGPAGSPAGSFFSSRPCVPTLRRTPHRHTHRA